MTPEQKTPRTLPGSEGLGIDLVQVHRIMQKLDNDTFLNRIFDPRELADVGEGPNRGARLAARWAAKEAFAKAVGTGFGEEVTWADVVVVRNDRGAPSLELSDRVKQLHGDPETLLSISHDGDYAIAIVWILSRREG